MAQLDAGKIIELVRVAVQVCVPAGEWLFHDGDEGDSLFIVETGRLEVLDHDDPLGNQPIRALAPGDAVGELALLCSARRSASVRAVRDSTLLQISRSALLQLFQEDGSFALALLHTVGEKLRSIAVHNSYVAPSPHVLAVMPLVPTAGDRARAIALALSSAVERWGQVAFLTSESVASADDAWAASVSALERDHELVILVGKGHDSNDEWDRFCVRQADRVVAVVDARYRPASVDDHPGWDLVVSGKATNPAEVRRWVAAVTPRSHHLVRDGIIGEDVERLARRILGRSIGIVFSGGGARGLAHLGVLDVLVRAGISIDRVGGTSMGAFVGALFASGPTNSELGRICRTELVERHPFRDFTVPRIALIKARRATAMLERVFGDAHLEDLAIDTFSVSADLSTAEVVVHRDGPIMEAVGASMSLPGLAPPVRSGARLLVDGGVLNNIPVDIMASTGEGPAIAIDVMTRLPIGGPGRLPSIVETLARASVIGSRHQATEQLAGAAAVIQPAVGNVGLLDFSRFDEIVEAGRRAARDAIDNGALQRALTL